MENNENIRIISNKVNEKLTKYEKWFLLILVIITTLKLTINFQIGILTVLVTLVLGSMYFFSAFSYDYNPELSLFDKFINKIIYWASSVSCVSILFKLLNYPGNDFFMKIGLSSIAVSILIILFRKMKGIESNVLNKSLIIRLVILITILIVFSLSKLTTPYNRRVHLIRS